MRFTSAILLGACAALATAQNAFTRTSYTGISAGSPINITWTPTTSGTVTLKLVQGNPSALTTISTVASSIPNSGSYVWTPSASIVQGSDYALEILDDGNENIYNYTPQFSIASSNTVSSATSSGASSTGSTTSGVSSTTSGSSATSSATTTGSSSSKTSGSSSSTATTKASSTSSAATSSAAASTASKAGAAAATAGAKIGAGMLGLVGAVMMAL